VDVDPGRVILLNGALFRELVHGYLQSVRAMALVGHNVISESVILPMNIDLYRAAFDGLSVFVAGIRCPIDVAEQRERARAPLERHEGVPIVLRVPEFDLVHANGRYDVEVDTSSASADQAVELIRAALDATGSGAFEEWGRPHR
jgi:chloramphenicol 3-O phosphotransferase